MNLHEAIRTILTERKGPMRAEELVKVITDRGLYTKKDRTPVSVNQIYARVANYKELFFAQDGEIYLRSLPDDSFVNVSRRIKTFLQARNIQSEILVPFLLVFFRFSQKKKQSVLFSLIEYKFRPIDYKEFRELTTIEKRNRLVDLVMELRAPYFGETAEVILGSLTAASVNELDDIFFLLEDINASCSDLSDHEFEKLFEDALVYFSGPRTHLEFKTPASVIDCISNIVKLEKSDAICDPFAGHGGLMTPIIKNINVDATLQDINPTVVLLGKLNMLVHGIKANFILGDSFHTRDVLAEKKFNWVITHPPFGWKISASSLPAEYLKIRSTSGDGAIVQLILSILSNEGKAVIALAESFFYGAVSENIRKFLLEQDLIEAVHSLPEGAFTAQARIKTSILVLNKSKDMSTTGRVTFKEVVSGQAKQGQDQLLIFKDTARQFERIVDLEEISKNDYILSVNRYLNVKQFGPEYLPLKDLLTKIKGGEPAPKSALISQGNVPFIKASNLAKSKIENTLNLEEVDQFLSSTEVSRNVIKKECVLVANHGTRLNPTYFKGGEPIAINQNILALFVNKDLILAQYLIHQLNQNYVEEQLQKIRGGITIPFVRQKDLQEIKISVPSLEQQQRELSALSDILTVREASGVYLKSDYQLAPSKSQNERKLLSSIKHEFSNLKAIVDGDFDLVKSFIDKKVKSNSSFTWDDSASSKPGARSIYQVFDNISKTLSQMGAAFPRLQQIIDFQRENLRKESVEIASFIKEHVTQLQNQLIGVKVSYKLNGEEVNDESDIDTPIDKSQFATVIQNFIFNCIKHGFVDEYAEHSTILFDISKSVDDLSVEIRMMNNGKPFPEHFTMEDFISFGVKSGSDGSGIGGFLMNQVIKNHGGKLELTSFDGDETFWLEPDHKVEGHGIVLADEYSMFWPSIEFKVTLPIE